MRDHHITKTAAGFDVTLHFDTWEQVAEWQANQVSRSDEPGRCECPFIPWERGENPLAGDVNARVRVLTDDGGSYECLASKVDWLNLGSERIVGYRLGSIGEKLVFTRNTGYGNPFIGTDPKIIVILKNKNVRVIKASLVNWTKPNGDDEVLEYCEYAKS